MNPQFNKWFAERFPYTVGFECRHEVSKPEMKSELEETWEAALKIGMQLGDAKGTLEWIAKSMEAGLIAKRKLTVNEYYLHLFVERHGLKSPVAHLL